MKRLLALILASLMMFSVLTGCSSEEDDKIKGAEIQAFVTTLPESIDPAAQYTTADTVKIMGLLYEGLTTIDENGKLKKALAKDWEYEVDERDDLLKLEITLTNSRWSDGIIVDADDFIYAWTRILLPESNNRNAALLYPILNARNVKEGLCSQNDLGVYAITDKTIQIVFEPSYAGGDHTKKENKKNVEEFLRRLASPALVPLREDVVSRGSDWCTTKATSFITNGPFKIKAFNTGELTFERSVYYRCVGDSEGNKDDKIVKPYRIITLYSEGKQVTDHVERYGEKEAFYLNLAGATDDDIKTLKKDGKVETENLLSVTTLYLDLSHATFANKDVRVALSKALDRKSIAKALPVDAIVATGFVPGGIENTKKGEDFRKKGGDVISDKADVKAAKKVITDGGYKGIIAIEYSNAKPDHGVIALECKEAWEKLGFKVTTSAKTQVYINNKIHGVYPMNQTYEDSGYACVVIGDAQSVTHDAMSLLLPYSAEYGGYVVDLTTGPSKEDVVYQTMPQGYYSAEYDALCGKFVNADSNDKRAKALHDAEKFLVGEMPVIPVVFNTSGYVSQELKNVKSDFFGRFDFVKLSQNNYKKYLPKEED